ncbi:Uncharacterised protein [Staphylococcus aureus]|uniref:Helicase Helix-turn-helix domain-containing protein n=1 Tax=Staphylococcus aureus TaxID=1280 RepID=A0A380E1K5_STAAU|nr:Uncharacterised protein [Staphylococcus aureus]
MLEQFTMEDIAAQQQVKINTIEDHVLEILIKVTCLITMIMLNKKINCIFEFYQQHRGERLKFYKEQFDTLSYFQIESINRWI